MGADGHIYIYDLEKLEKILGKKFETDSAHIYIHDFQGKKVVTQYYGDNLSWCDCLVCGKPDCEEKHDDLIQQAFITHWEIWT